MKGRIADDVRTISIFEIPFVERLARNVMEDGRCS